MNSKKRSGWKALAAMAVVSGCMSGSEAEKPVEVEVEVDGPSPEGENPVIGNVDDPEDGDQVIACEDMRATAFVLPVGDPYDMAGTRITQGFDTSIEEGFCLVNRRFRADILALAACRAAGGSWYYRHTGNDIAIAAGNPVRAVAVGVVTAAGYFGGHGWVVRIRSMLEDGTEFYHQYGHMCESSNDNCLTVGVGDCVELGQEIGVVGSTGNSSGPHLHFEIKYLDSNGPGYLFDDPERNLRFYEDGIAFIESRPILSRWHPGNTLYKVGGHPEIKLVDGTELQWITQWQTFTDERHEIGRVVVGPREYELCYNQGSDIVSATHRRLVRCNGEVWMATEESRLRSMINPVEGSEEFLALIASWGFTSREIVDDARVCREYAETTGMALREGVLIKEEDRSDVYFIAPGAQAWPVETMPILHALGYQGRNLDPRDIMVIPAGLLEDMVWVVRRDRPIETDDLPICYTNGLAYGPPPEDGEGGVDFPEFDGEGCLPAVETCNAVDDDCDGLVDEGEVCAEVCNASPEVCDEADNDCDGRVDNGFSLGWDEENCGECGRACEDDEICVNGECADECIPTGAELCNDWDDDCDGEADEGFDLESDHDNCGACRNRCVVNEECFHGACRHIAFPESCNNEDDDYDGVVDNYTISCETRCGQGTQRCVAGGWEECNAPLPGAEVCNSIDDDCDGVVDEGVLNACGGCGNVPAESCGNNRDDNCNGSVDEDCVQVQVCNPIAETCNGSDDDCDGVVDENLSRACETACGNGNQTCGNGVWGTCSARQPSPESCNGSDDDCDGLIDEGVLNACGRCGNVPVEVCDGADNDCDGVVDDGVRNACGGCGQAPIESCNGIDDDCDGSTDEGVLNACGLCGNVPAEVCNNADDDCDGLIDEGVDCPRGHTVRVRFCPREDGTFDSDLPDGNGWYARTMDNGCIDITWNNVPEMEYRLQGTYLDGTAWECNEWPLGTVWLRNNTVPEVWVDGVQVEVTYGHDPRMGVGCNFFVTVS